MGTAQSTEDTDFVPLPHQRYSAVEVAHFPLQQHKEDEQDKFDKLENCTISFWKMNLLVAWKDMLFVGEANQLLVFKLHHLTQPWKTLNLNGAEINQIRGGILNGKVPIIMSVDDAGDVKVIFLENLAREPIEFSNEVSTWGCAVSSVGMKIAVSANSHNITLWDLQTRDKVTCEGHAHNIPSIDFSPCGAFVASASIDTTVRVWHTDTGREIAKKKVCREWGWSCRWIPAHTIKTVAVEQTVWDTLHSRLREYFAVAPGEEDQEDDDLFDDSDEDEDASDSDLLGEQEPHHSEYNAEPEEMDSAPQSPHNEQLHATEPVESQDEELPNLIDNVEEHPNEESSQEEEEDLEDIEPDQAVLKRILTLLRSRQSKAKPKRQKRNPKKEENLPPIEPPSDYLIFASQHHLYLLNNKLETVAVLYNAIPRPLIPVPMWMHPMQRISLLEYIPELSLVVVGSQGCASVLLVRIVKNSQTGVYELLPEKALPHNPVASPIAGMWITKHLPNQPGTFHTWNPSMSCKKEPQTSQSNENNNNNNNASTSTTSQDDWEELNMEGTQQFFGGSFCMWRLYILFQNNKIFCYELRRDDSVNNLANLTETFL